MATNKPVLGYWKMRGYAQVTRLLLHYLEVDYEDKFYEFSPAPDYKSDFRTNHKPYLGLDFPNIPYWKDGDVNMTESIPIFRQVARKYGPQLFPSDPETVWKVEMVESYIVDVLISFCHHIYHSEELFENLQNSQPYKFEKLQEFFGDNPWILGSELTYLDFILYETLYQHRYLKADILDNYPRLLNHISKFEALPAIQKYMESSDYIKGPLYTPVAKHKI